MGKSIGYARVSTRGQDSDRQIIDLKALGKVRGDDLYVDHGVSGARSSRPGLDKAMAALEAGDTLVVATLDRLGRSTENMLKLAAELRGREIELRVLNLGGQVIDTSTPMGEMMFTVMVALAQMELDIKKERASDSVTKRRAAGKDLGGRPTKYTESQILNAKRLIDSETTSLTQVAKDMGISRATLYRRLQALDPDRVWIPAVVPRPKQKGGNK